jgi:hypothetical protein
VGNVKDQAGDSTSLRIEVKNAKDQAGRVNEIKNRIEKCKGPGDKGTNDCFKRKFFKKTKNINQTLLK